MNYEDENFQQIKRNSNVNDDDSINSDYFENNNDEEKLNFSEEDKDNDYQENSNILLENIITILEKLPLNFDDNKKVLFNLLKEINISINLLINEFTNESNKKLDLHNDEQNINNFFLTENIDEKNKIEENKNYKLNTNSKVVFLLKIDILNRKIASLNEEIKNLKILLFKSNNKINKNNKNNYYKFFMKKFKEIKDQKKCDDFKYLFFIENQKKKIMELEEKLKIKNNQNLPKETLKAIRCFPNFVQYDFKEDINPKTIPLSQFLQKNKEKEKELENIKNTPKKEELNCNSFRNKNKNQIQIQSLPNTINSNYSHKKKGFKTKEITISDKLRTDENHYNTINIKDIKNNFKLFSLNNRYYSNNHINFSKTDKIQNLDSGRSKNQTISYEKNKQKKEKEKKDLMLEIKKFSPKTIINNKREFFIAHPTLDIAGVAKGKEQAYIGLPKKLLKLSKGGNFKSTMMVFPSSLNETMVNLEKLRSNKLHVDINKKDN